MRIALCDDSPREQEQFVRALHGWDPTRQPECFLTGAALLDAAKLGPPFDIACLDIYMPDENGVDIAAETGTEVCAAADGKVYTVYEDDAMGCTVVIRHDGGYTTRYSSLAEELTVKAGDEVKAGQVIGSVGDTALVETTLGTHVHFGVTFRDTPMDPAEFLALGS